MQKSVKVPSHVAIVMDGNGRWAEERGEKRSFGHKRGVAVVREIIGTAVSLEIPCLTLFAFSSENHKRPEYEVNSILNLLWQFTSNELHRLVKADICVRFIGDKTDLPLPLCLAMKAAEKGTKQCNGMKLQIAISYGGRNEIVRAASKLSGQSDDITEEQFSLALDTAGLPDPDLLIRTGGECRLSGFLLYQAAYAELRFLDVLWPDFTPELFLLELEWFRSRQRRFGRVLAEVV